ncbi:MAG: endonuclease/exonuclease/phosphatase family protein [Myxococcota bacterium]|nr:endonuclease/exonuclease/phosphatase family protein [Myxococcota bacterium]
MAKSKFKIATFNLYNLVWPNIIYYGKKKYGPTDYNRKVEWIGHQLSAMKADIVGFQEIFHKKALEEALVQSDFYNDAAISIADPSGKSLVEEPAQDEDLGPVVGLVSRFPIVDESVFTEFPAEAILDIDGDDIPLKAFSRPVLRARVQLNDQHAVTVFVVHLKSKRPKMGAGADPYDPVEKAKGQARSLILRAAEATGLRAILMETLQSSNDPVIVLGDVNDGDLAVTTQIATGEPPWRRLSFGAKKKIWDVLLYHVKQIQARNSYRDFYFTHIHNGHYEALDHIMVSQEFVYQNPARIGKVVYVRTLNDHIVDDTLSPDSVKKWQSDHGQVVASIELKQED